MEIQELKNISSQVRRDILRMTHKAASGHPGGSLGCADFMVALYFNQLNHHPENFSMDAIGEDVFFLSNGHISPVFYSVLARTGYFDINELNTFRFLNSRLQGHPATHEGLPGVRMASGSLGQGLSVACGAAQAKKLNNDKSFVFTLHGDGEMQEGQNWEAFMYAAHNKLDNIIATIDYNNAQIDGKVDDVMGLGNLAQKIESFGWSVIELKEGNDIEKVNNAISEAKSLAHNGKPICIVMHTKMGFGVDFMSDNYKWHGVAPNDEQLNNALAQLEETLGDY